MKLETMMIHAGFTPDPTTKSVAVPIYQTASYAFDNTQHGADLFNLAVPGNIYTRIMNPTNDVLEKRIAMLEGGIGGLAFASGMAAITTAIQTLAAMGDNIVSSSTLYGGTLNLFGHMLPSCGIEVRLAESIAQFEPLIDSQTKAIFCESVGNPKGNIADLATLADIAHRHGIPLIVDNTVATPYFCRPFEHGADIVVHSLTKYLGGHGTSIGGAIVDSGKFDWHLHKKRFPKFSEPELGYHGVVFSESFKEAAYIARARCMGLRSTGATLSPFNAFLILQGIETLALRMDRISENTLKVAHFLNDHPKVAWVNYAGLETHLEHDLLIKYCNGRASGVLSFGIKTSDTESIIQSASRFIDSLCLITRLVNIGDAKSLACHPASTTHRQLDEMGLRQAGVSEDMIRLSIGIEHIDDLISDLTHALG